MNYKRTEMIVIGSFNMLMTVLNLTMVALKTFITGKTYWSSHWGPIETLFCILNFTTCVFIFMEGYNLLIRYLEAITFILLALIGTYFMQLHPKVAPLIIIWYKVLYEVFYILFVIVTMAIAFGTAFYLIGRN